MRAIKAVAASLLLLTAFGFPVLLSPAAAFAVDPFEQSCDVASSTEFCQNANQEKNRPFLRGENSLMVRIAQIIVFVTAAISVIMIIIGGIKYVISNGDSNATANAKNTVMYAVVGLVVALLAQLIVSFVLTKVFNS